MNAFKRLIVITFFAMLVSQNLAAESATSKSAQDLYNSGGYQAAADLLVGYINGEGANDPEALLLYGKALDKMTEGINTDAEKKCYRSAGAPHTPKCMYDYASRLNSKYGPGTFEYVHAIITIKYTGVQFKELLSKFPNSDAAAEAAYFELTKNLIGPPEEVIPRIEDYLKKYKKGKWHNSALLLLARINEDIWYIHKEWSWMLYGNTLSEDQLIIKGEPYRKEAMRLFKKVRGGEEGKAAKRELQLLKNNQTDGKIYGIVNESSIEGASTSPGNKQVQ